MNHDERWRRYGTIRSADVVLRNGPGSEFERIGECAKSSQIKIISRSINKTNVGRDSDFWYLISDNGRYGWIQGKYLACNDKSIFDEGEIKLVIKNNNYELYYLSRGKALSVQIDRREVTITDKYLIIFASALSPYNNEICLYFPNGVYRFEKNGQLSAYVYNGDETITAYPESLSPNENYMFIKYGTDGLHGGFLYDIDSGIIIDEISSTGIIEWISKTALLYSRIHSEYGLRKWEGSYKGYTGIELYEIEKKTAVPILLPTEEYNYELEKYESGTVYYKKYNNNIEVKESMFFTGSMQ